MSKNNTVKLDKNDQKILLELETDARQSSARIARKVKISKDIVNYRIKKYLKDGIITKFFIIPRFDKLGFHTYRFYFQFRATSTEKENEIINYISNNMPCQWMGVCDGKWNLIGRISAKDIFQYNNMMDEFFSIYGKYIARKEFAEQLSHTWWPSTYGLTSTGLSKRKLKHIIPQNIDLIKYDNLDLLILSILIENARMSTIDIAKATNSSPDTVRKRIKSMQKDGIITQVKSYFNREKLGYQHMQVFTNLLQDKKRISELIKYLNNNKSCFFISSMVGAWDMQFGIDAKNSLEFHKILGDVKEKFSDVIANYETLIIYKEYAPNPFKYFLKNNK